MSQSAVPASASVRPRSPTPEPWMDTVARLGWGGTTRVLERVNGVIPHMDIETSWDVADTVMEMQMMDGIEICHPHSTSPPPSPPRSPLWRDSVADDAEYGNGWGDEAIFLHHDPDE